METTTIKRECDIFRPYAVNGKTVEDIYIYKDGEILINVRQGWLETVNEDFSHAYAGDLLEVTLEGNVKWANKLNLDRKDNFLFKAKKDYYVNSKYSLFIYADNLLESWEELPRKYRSGDNDYFLYGYKVKLKYPAKKHEPYLKYYNKNDVIEPQDIKAALHPCVMKDSNGKPMKDSAGRYIYDENRLCCMRLRIVDITDCIFHNGKYIKEGK